MNLFMPTTTNRFPTLSKEASATPLCQKCTCVTRMRRKMLWKCCFRESRICHFMMCKWHWRILGKKKSCWLRCVMMTKLETLWRNSLARCRKALDRFPESEVERQRVVVHSRSNRNVAEIAAYGQSPYGIEGGGENVNGATREGVILLSQNTP